MLEEFILLQRASSMEEILHIPFSIEELVGLKVGTEYITIGLAEATRIEMPFSEGFDPGEHSVSRSGEGEMISDTW
jgi:hypothetical protein